MSDHEVTLDDLLRDMLWDRRDAVRLRRQRALSLFEDRAPIAAVIEHHDKHRPDAPRDGAARVQSILAYALNLASDVDAHPDRYTPAAALHARATGDTDPMLLSRVRTAIRDLPAILTGPDEVAGHPR